METYLDHEQAPVARRRARARWSVALAIVALGTFVGWLGWTKPDRAVALGGPIVATVTVPPLQPAPQSSVDRSGEAPSIVSAVQVSFVPNNAAPKAVVVPKARPVSLQKAKVIELERVFS